MQAPVWPKRIIIPEHIELNVGGKLFSTTKRTLCKEKYSLLATLFSGRVQLQKDSRGKYFIDRDGILFAYVLDFLRKGFLILPDDFDEYNRLFEEAEFYKLGSLVKALRNLKDENSEFPATRKRIGSKERFPLSRSSSSCPNLSISSYRSDQTEKFHSDLEYPSIPKQQPGDFISINFQATLGLGGREHLDLVSFRKIQRILVSGHVSILMSVFKNTLNTSRSMDPDSNRYTSRYYLTYTNVNQAFERLQECGFRLISSGLGKTRYYNSSDENRWDHCIAYVFFRSCT